MVFFVIQVLTMIREAGHQQKEWDKIEESIRHQRTHNPTQAEQDQVYDLQRRPWYTLFCTRLWSNQRAVVAREEAVYRALRREFILDRALDPPFEVRGPEKRIQDTFNFARYLGLAQIHILSHAVEVQKGTWMFFAFSSIVFYYIAVLVEEKIEVSQDLSTQECGCLDLHVHTLFSRLFGRALAGFGWQSDGRCSWATLSLSPT